VTSRLLVGVLGAVALVWLATAVVSYRDARREIDALLDAHLSQAAALLVAQAVHEVEEIKTEHSPAMAPYGQKVAFQVWEHGRRLRVHSVDAPNERLSSQAEGFSDVTIEGRPWRVFSTWANRRRVLIQVGEERAGRDRLAAAIATNLLTPLALALPVLGLLVWLAVRWGTRPLATLRAQVLQRAPDNLAPLEVAAPPAEIAPLVASLNRLLERVRASVESERRFTADAAHELRTPVAAVRAHAEVARAATADVERRAALDSILAGTDRAAHAIDQLLTLARLDPRDPRERPEPCDVRAVAKTILAELAPAAIAKGVEVELAPGPPSMIDGSPGLLHVLVRNLVDNAVRYSPAGTNVRVDVDGDVANVRLVVTDDGPGVASEQRRALGERFYRVPGSQEIGTGLGLSIVRRIADLHHANVAFDDGPGGRGLSVVVTFPASSTARPWV
jgi:two-component system, OmpR family, sensor kinase